MSRRLPPSLTQHWPSSSVTVPAVGCSTLCWPLQPWERAVLTYLVGHVPPPDFATGRLLEDDVRFCLSSPNGALLLVAACSTPLQALAQLWVADDVSRQPSRKESREVSLSLVGLCALSKEGELGSVAGRHPDGRGCRAWFERARPMENLDGALMAFFNLLPQLRRGPPAGHAGCCVVKLTFGQARCLRSAFAFCLVLTSHPVPFSLLAAVASLLVRSVSSFALALSSPLNNAYRSIWLSCFGRVNNLIIPRQGPTPALIRACWSSDRCSGTSDSSQACLCCPKH